MADILFINGEETDKAVNSAGIYYWENNVNGKRYVGQSLRIRERMQEYRRTGCYSQRKLFNAFSKYGITNFTCYKIMDCCPSKVALNYWETYWIKELDTFGANGYNLTTGGDCFTRSEESRLKMSIAKRGKPPPNKGRKSSPETIEKIRKAKTGKKMGPCSELRKKRIGDANRGRVYTAEQRLASSIAHKLAYARRKQKEMQLTA